MVTYEGGREKAPAALCSKMALAQDGGEIEVSVDGEEACSVPYVEDGVEGVQLSMRFDFPGPDPRLACEDQ